MRMKLIETLKFGSNEYHISKVIYDEIDFFSIKIYKAFFNDNATGFDYEKNLGIDFSDGVAKAYEISHNRNHSSSGGSFLDEISPIYYDIIEEFKTLIESGKLEFSSNAKEVFYDIYNNMMINLKKGVK
ncbi:MAG: hypothetical protein RSA10_01890 [Bacilli bacterium]